MNNSCAMLKISCNVKNMNSSVFSARILDLKDNTYIEREIPSNKSVILNLQPSDYQIEIRTDEYNPGGIVKYLSLKKKDRVGLNLNFT